MLLGHYIIVYRVSVRKTLGFSFLGNSLVFFCSYMDILGRRRYNPSNKNKQQLKVSMTVKRDKLDSGKI